MDPSKSALSSRQGSLVSPHNARSFCIQPLNTNPAAGSATKVSSNATSLMSTEQICPAEHSIAPERVVTRPSTGLSISTVAKILGSSGVGSRAVSEPADEPPPHAESAVSVYISSVCVRFTELAFLSCLVESAPRWVAMAKK